jgi:hypothetical protein
MPQLPGPFRAALGVIATVVDDRRTLPDRALELPVLAVSTALQMSLRAQQRYAALTAKGDEFLSQLRGAPDEAPPWATFDDDPAPTAAEPEPFRSESFGGDPDTPPVEPQAPPVEPQAPRAVKAPAKRSPKSTAKAKPAGAAKINKPRAGQPSAFDIVPDDLPELEGFGIEHPTEG